MNKSLSSRYENALKDLDYIICALIDENNILKEELEKSSDKINDLSDQLEELKSKK